MAPYELGPLMSNSPESWYSRIKRHQSPAQIVCYLCFWPTGYTCLESPDLQLPHPCRTPTRWWKAENILPSHTAKLLRHRTKWKETLIRPLFSPFLTNDTKDRERKTVTTLGGKGSIQVLYQTDQPTVAKSQELAPQIFTPANLILEFLPSAGFCPLSQHLLSAAALGQVMSSQ